MFIGKKKKTHRSNKILSQKIRKCFIFPKNNSHPGIICLLKISHAGSGLLSKRTKHVGSKGFTYRAFRKAHGPADQTVNNSDQQVHNRDKAACSVIYYK